MTAEEKKAAAAAAAAAAKKAAEAEKQDEEILPPVPLDSNGLGEGKVLTVQDFDDFFNFSEDGDEMTGELMRYYANPKIGENGFTGYIFRLWDKNLAKEDRRKLAVRSSYVLDKHFRGVNAERDPKHVFKITRTGSRDLEGGKTVKIFNIVRYKNPEYQA